MEAENGNYPEQTTLQEILGIVAARHDAVFKQIVFDGEGRVRRPLMVLINDDAIERDDHTIRLDAPPNNPLHKLLVDSGGRFHNHEADLGQVFMATVFDPIALLQSMKAKMHDRVKRASLSCPFEVGRLCNAQ